jgi:outer membrane lipoprotein-sorting protein
MDRLSIGLRRAPALIAAAAAAALCSLAAAPASAGPGAASAPAKAGSAADAAYAKALLAKSRALYKTANSLSASLSITMARGGETAAQSGAVRLRKPNLARIEMATPGQMLMMSDGKNLYTLMPDHQYIQQSAEAFGLGQAELAAGLPVALFFGHDSVGVGSLTEPGATVKYLGKQAVGGQKYDVASVSGKSPIPHTIKVFMQPDGLIGRTEVELSIQGAKLTQTSDYKNQKINAVPATTSFAVALPKDARLYKAPAEDQYTSKFVALGKPAPVFALPTPTGGTVSLASSTADHKAVLVNFWFYG